jgi:multicomponent Na+:H+ antiporter subunit D
VRVREHHGQDRRAETHRSVKPELIMPLAIAVPVAGAGLTGLLRDRPDLRESVTLLCAASLCTLVALLLPPVMAGSRPHVALIETLPGLSLALEAEPLGLLFALIAAFLWLVTSVYSIGYMRRHRERHQTRFYVYFALALASTTGVAFSANMFTLFVFYEMLTLTTYPLVTHSGSREAQRGGRVYIGLLLFTSIGFLLTAIIWTWLIAGTLDFREGGIFRDPSTRSHAGVLLVLYLFGIGKTAIMPFHRWLPAAMVAPTPVSALLHAVAVVKAGVFALLKVSIYLFGTDVLHMIGAARWLVYVAAATTLTASVVALSRDNLKIRLAYSTISQLAYVVAGAIIANPASVLGASLQIATHAFAKITLFFCAGAIMISSHKTRVSQMRGVGRHMPITMGAFFIASLSIIGLPPLAGFWSKWYLLSGALEGEQFVFLGALVLSTVMSIFYLLRIPVIGFFGRPVEPRPVPGIREAPLTCVAALLITTLGCVLLFVFPDPVYRLVLPLTRQ